MAQRLDTGGLFAVVRRGFDPDQVSARILALEDEVRSLRLRAERAEEIAAEMRRNPGGFELDEATVASRLGEEAARVLTAAHQAASDMRARAEEHLHRALREAQDEANRTRADAEIDAARRRQDAVAAAEQEIEAAKHQGREMLAEAHAVRERVLADLARRRDAGRRQLEQLKEGRDRLLAAYDVVRRSLAQVTDELSRSVPEAQSLAEGALARPLSDAGSGGDSDAWLADLDRRDTGEVAIITALAPAAPPIEIAPVVVAGLPEAATPELDVETVAAVEVSAAETEADATAGEDLGAPTEPEFASDAPTFVVLDDDGSPVDDLFARLRASRETAVASARTVLADDVVLDLTDAALNGAAPEEPDDAVVVAVPVAPPEFERRTAELHPVEQTLSRHLKRVMADEQNDVFDRLRRAPSTPSAEVVFGNEMDYVERYRVAAEADLRTAAIAGARSAGASPLEAGAMIDKARVVDLCLAEVGLEIATPLRTRLVETLSEAGRDADEATGGLRAAYREWKTQRLEVLAGHAAVGAYERGALAALPTGTCVRWMVDPNGPVCPDAEDNALAGPLVVGEAFPTGHTAPPAHLGCRCHIAAV